MAIIGKYNKVIFLPEDIQFIKDNFYNMTNQQLADALGLKKTIVRTKAYELGLKRMTLEYWPTEAVEFLKANYREIGNVEIVHLFTEKYPKEKGWSTSHIDKKLEQLHLKRNKQDWYNIIERNRQNGSYGTPNPKKEVKKLKMILSFKGKKYLLKPEQTKQELFELIITNKIQPIENEQTI